MARGPAKDKVAVIAPAVAVNSEHDDLVRKRDAVSIHPRPSPPPPKMRSGPLQRVHPIVDTSFFFCLSYFIIHRAFLLFLCCFL